MISGLHSSSSDTCSKVSACLLASSLLRSSTASAERVRSARSELLTISPVMARKLSAVSLAPDTCILLQQLKECYSDNSRKGNNTHEDAEGYSSFAAHDELGRWRLYAAVVSMYHGSLHFPCFASQHAVHDMFTVAASTISMQMHDHEQQQAEWGR